MQLSPSPRSGSLGRQTKSPAPPNGSTAQAHEPDTRAGGRTRNQAFEPIREPLKERPELQLRDSRTTGPFSFLNPTTAHFHTSPKPGEMTSAHHGPVAFHWSSRNNRKGRHALAVSPEAKNTAPRPSSSSGAILRGIWRMLTVYPVWDVSYDVATIFTLGSVVWVINAFFVWYPLVRPESEFNNEILYGGGITAFIGATIFVVGSVLLLAEAVNENRTGCFGWALEQHVASHHHDAELAHAPGGGARLLPSAGACSHHHTNRRNLVGAASSSSGSSSSSDDAGKSWTWFPSTHDLRTHYLHELGFLASAVQLCAASIFWVSGLTALPGIYTRMLSPAVLDVFYWTPQVVGGCGFIVSGTLFMLETQRRWYVPAFGTLGWWIGAWNLIGGLGFAMCPAFGYDTASWAVYQSSLSTFWGSWAFLIGSVVQWYESLEKFPVVVDETLGGGGGN